MQRLIATVNLQLTGLHLLAEQIQLQLRDDDLRVSREKSFLSEAVLLRWQHRLEIARVTGATQALLRVLYEMYSDQELEPAEKALLTDTLDRLEELHHKSLEFMHILTKVKEILE